MNAAHLLEQLERDGNLRRLPADESGAPLVDLSSNDYLGLAARDDLRRRFLEEAASDGAALMTASASRLLGASQDAYMRLEERLADEYGRPALLFNSGYHANTGIVSALASAARTLIVADKLVHASIIDGMAMSKAPFTRFPHNDVGRLRRILDKAVASGEYEQILLVVESVYSMDGDTAPLADIDALRRSYGDAVTLYVDEAHAVGVCGPRGLGLCRGEGVVPDVMVGTFGKALASSGAFAVVADDSLKALLVNKARSLIFSTALPPVCALWSLAMFDAATAMDAERRRLCSLGALLKPLTGSESHIQPVVVGDPRRAVELSQRLRDDGFKVLPIRTPTVPPGTERLRVSLSAALADDDILRFSDALKRYICTDA